MNIYIIAQNMIFSGQDEDPLFKLGKEYVDWGHKVTVFTTAGAKNINFKGKKIGLLQEEGVNLIIFNISSLGKNLVCFNWLRSLKYAWLTSRQGRNLPRPDIIFALLSPLTALLPAMSLSSQYSAPLVTEVREVRGIWPNGSVQQGKIGSKILLETKRRLLQRAYDNSDHIIAGEKGIAETVKAKLGKGDKVKKVSIVSRDLQGKELIDSYDRVIAGLLKNKD